MTSNVAQLAQSGTGKAARRAGDGAVAGRALGDRRVSLDQFERSKRFASRLAGIELHERHRDLLGQRSGRLARDDANWFEALLQAVEAGEPAAERDFIGLLTTNFTGFFRHPRQFEIAAEHALWTVHRRGTVRLWSAAAATGEEPYSLAMILQEVFRRPDPPATILASDLDEMALETARRGEYSDPAVAAIEGDRRLRFLAKPPESERWRIVPDVRALVEFRRLNLVDVAWSAEGPFDVIFCRNVLMYLDGGHRYAVLERLASLLASDGLLFLDPAEHLGKADHFFTPGNGGVHSHRRAGLTTAVSSMNRAQPKGTP